MIFVAEGKPDIEALNKETKEWTMRAARMECDWICSDCGGHDSRGMPDECFHGNDRCTAIIRRDKALAHRGANQEKS